jgi:hypothetical protein
MSLVLQMGIAAEPNAVTPADAPEPAEPPRFKPHVSRERILRFMKDRTVNGTSA